MTEENEDIGTLAGKTEEETQNAIMAFQERKVPTADEMVEALHETTGDLDREQRSKISLLPTLYAAAKEQDWGLVKQAIAGLPMVGTKLVKLRSYSEILEEQVRTLKVRASDLQDEIGDADIARDEALKLMNQYINDRVTKRADHKEQSSQVKEMKSELGKIEQQYETIKADIIKAKRIKKPDSEKIAHLEDLLMTAQDEKFSYEEEVYRETSKLSLLASGVRQCTNNIDYLETYHQNSRLQLIHAKSIYNSIMDKVDAMEPNIKTQVQQLKLTEVAALGSAEYERTQDMCNGALAIVGRMNSYMANLSAKVNGDFYSADALDDFSAMTDELKETTDILNAMEIREGISEKISIKECYQILELDKTPGVKIQGTTIKKAYRTATVKVHPDTNPNNPNAEEDLRKVTIAYDRVYNRETGQPPKGAR